MKKIDLINAVRTQLDYTKAEATLVVDAVLDAMKKGYIEDGVLDIYGFFKFELADKAARSGEMTLPDGTKKPWTSEAHKAPKASFAKAIKEAVYKL